MKHLAELDKILNGKHPDLDNTPDELLTESVILPAYSGVLGSRVRILTPAQYEAEKGPLSLRNRPRAV